MSKQLKQISLYASLSILVISSCTNPAKEDTINRPITNSSVNPDQKFNFPKFDSSKVKVKDTLNIKLYPNFETIEMITDYNWTWVDSQGNLRNSVTSYALTDSINIPGAHNPRGYSGNDVKPIPIWSEINGRNSQFPGTAKCGDCSFTFNRQIGLDFASDIFSMNVTVQADDSLKIFMNNTFVQQVNYNEVKTVSIPTNLLRNGLNILSLQGYNGPVIDSYEAYNYAAVAAKVVFQAKPDSAIYPCGDAVAIKAQSPDVKLTYANFKTKTYDMPPNPCSEQSNPDQPYITDIQYSPYGKDVKYGSYTFGIKGNQSCQ